MAQETVDMPTILTYIKYLVEHMKDLLIDYRNPVLWARYFDVIFNEVPTYEEISCRTPEIEKIPGVNKLFKLAHTREVSFGADERTWSRSATPEVRDCKHSSHRNIPLRSVTGTSHLHFCEASNLSLHTKLKTGQKTDF